MLAFISKFLGFVGWFILVYLGLEGLGVFVVLVFVFFCLGSVFVFLLFWFCFCFFALFLFCCWTVFGVVLV